MAALQVGFYHLAGVLVTPLCVHMFMHVSMKIDLYLSTADRYQGP